MTRLINTKFREIKFFKKLHTHSGMHLYKAKQKIHNMFVLSLTTEVIVNHPGEDIEQSHGHS